MKLGRNLYKTLVASNVSEQNATSITDALENVMTTALASKTDLSEARNELKAEITGVRDELKAEIAGVRHDLHELKLDMTKLEANMTTFRTEIRADMTTFRTEIRADMSEIRHTMEVNGERHSKELAKQENKLTLRFGTMLVGGLSLLFAALKYL
ncbi:DUF1640 domain-containing protein [Pseudomonas vanderleydeniana]|uniref:DUF1640 domain-containing protein n=1 Tax=Pseudomonas vanderleydeniana TaxID=2745495 RepID=A0A9E6TQD0_9PSED|nr:DUF1640 domain-containing protein [Pseudomonas vanderleydeniana]QXI26307.1 DUF1640 domain-containing protein [Pseudomonas vanderleydeniana]